MLPNAKQHIVVLFVSGAVMGGLASACADSAPTSTDRGRIFDAGTPDGDDDGGSVGGGGLVPPAPLGLAVVSSDYMTTSISIVSRLGALVADDCINSATGTGGDPTLALSGDVTLPSQPQPSNELWLIDRGNAVLTVVEAASCTVWRQFSVGTGFRANPHDLVRVSAGKAYVTRFEKNRVATGANSGGDDVLIINPESGAVLGRIDLTSFAAPDGDTVTQARPDRAVLAAGKVFVTLGSQDAQLVATGEGRVVIIDPATDRVTVSLPIEGLKNCSGMTVSPDGQTLYVACGGAFGSPDQVLQSGVALVDLGASPPAVTRIISSQAIGGRALNFAWVGVATPTRAFAGTFGAFGDAAHPDVGDAVHAFDPTTGRSTKVGMAGPFDLGRAASGGGLLLLPDASGATPRLHVFDVTGETVTETASFDPEAAHGLPPREIAWY